MTVDFNSRRDKVTTSTTKESQMSFNNEILVALHAVTSKMDATRSAANLFKSSTMRKDIEVAQLVLLQTYNRGN